MQLKKTVKHCVLRWMVQIWCSSQQAWVFDEAEATSIGGR
jgi:hypothetical protein